MSKSLIKLVDYSILPAALLVVGKFLGLFVAVNFFSLDWGVESIPNSVFSVRPLFYSEDILLASSYSDLIMFLILVTVYSFIVLQAVLFHNTHISPTVLARLANNNLLGLVKGTFEIYHKAAIWTVFLWLANVLIFLNVALGKTYLWITAFTIITSVVLTVMLIRDASQEIELSKKEVIKKY